MGASSSSAASKGVACVVEELAGYDLGNQVVGVSVLGKLLEEGAYRAEARVFRSPMPCIPLLANTATYSTKPGGGVNLTEFSQGFVWFFTAGQVHIRGMFSHFAMRIWLHAPPALPATARLLNEDKEGSRIDFRIERCSGGVALQRVAASHREAGEKECRVVLADEFPKGKLTLGDVLTFARHQNTMPYNVVTKNCKHFVYDFFHECLGEARGFDEFCRDIERAFQ